MNPGSASAHLNMTILYTHTHADTILPWSLLWFVAYHVGQEGDSLRLPSLCLFWAPRLGHQALNTISFHFDFRVIREKSLLTEKKKAEKKRENTTWVKHQWEWWGDGESHWWRAGGGMMKRSCRLDLWRASGKCRDNFKRAPWNIQHTTTTTAATAAAAVTVAPKPRTSRCGVFQLVVFCSCSPLIFFPHGWELLPVKHEQLENRLLSFSSPYLLNFELCQDRRFFFIRHLKEIWQWIRCGSSLCLPPLFKSISSSISLHASHLSLSAISSLLCLHLPLPCCMCVLPFNPTIYLSVSLYLAFFLCVCMCACVCVCVWEREREPGWCRWDSDTWFAASLSVRGHQIINPTHTLSRTHICRQTHICAHTHIHTYIHTHSVWGDKGVFEGGN